QPGEHRPLSHFRVSYRGKHLDDFTLRVPGAHNLLNATAAIAVGIGLDVPVDSIRTALENFHGVDRRFQLRGRVAGISVIDDYGHHPTEIKATLAAARQCGFRKVHVIFQPHRYTRTKSLMEEFTQAFQDADSLAVLDIYAASEHPIEGISGETLAARIQEANGRNVRYVRSFPEAAEVALGEAQEGDMILTLGAGSVSQLGAAILQRLQQRVPVEQA
ncbi:MAG TPA: cyanophycin synthetase, partial [Terriglobales bacterium]|nr:cyanophycin synthetase [Terriglobales bacterium]